MNSQVHIRNSNALLFIWLRATEKLQEQCLAAKLSYQAWRRFGADLGLLRKREQNQGWLLFSVGINAAWQGSRARSLGKCQEPGRSQGFCRITDIMLNADPAFFGKSDPYPPQKQPAAAVYVISLFRSVFDRD